MHGTGRLARVFLAAAFLAASAPASATPITLEIVWTATTATRPASLASLGTPDYVGLPGDIATAELVITIAEGTTISTYSASIQFDAELQDQLDVVSAESLFFVFIPEDAIPPTWVWPKHVILETEESTASDAGLLTSFSHQRFDDLPMGPFTVTVGTVNFLLAESLTPTGTLVEPGYFLLGRDSWIDGNLTNRGATGLTAFAGSVRAVPEPRTAILLAAGLLAMLAWRRR